MLAYLDRPLQVDRLDALIVPVGGGGLISGIAVAAKVTETCSVRAQSAKLSLRTDARLWQHQPLFMQPSILTG